MSSDIEYKCIIITINSIQLCGQKLASVLTKMLPISSKIESINSTVKIWNLGYVFYCRSYLKNGKRVFSHHLFTLEKIFIAVYNLLRLFMSSSFGRWPNFQILANNHTFIVGFFTMHFMIFFLSLWVAGILINSRLTFHTIETPFLRISDLFIFLDPLCAKMTNFGSCI